MKHRKESYITIAAGEGWESKKQKTKKKQPKKHPASDKNLSSLKKSGDCVCTQNNICLFLYSEKGNLP